MNFMDTLLDPPEVYKPTSIEYVRNSAAKKLIRHGHILYEDVIVGIGRKSGDIFTNERTSIHQFYIITYGMETFYVRFTNNICTSIVNLATNSEVTNELY